MFEPSSLLQNAAYIIPLNLSLTVHEWAHAYSAFRLGDDTASRLGRLTLNPLAHYDPIGSILLPLLGVPFGWARPVPVNPTRFRRGVHMRTGLMITASAGPVSNGVLALACVIAIGVMARFSLRQPAVEMLLKMGIQLNVALAVFNLLPLVPLDGSRVADGLMPLRLRPAWERFAKYGPLILLAIVAIPQLQFIFAWPMAYIYRGISSLLHVIAGA